MSLLPFIPRKEHLMKVRLKDVYVITERGDQNKTVWSKIGVAFVNHDDSLNVVLDAIPLTGKIHIRDRKDQNTLKKGDK